MESINFFVRKKNQSNKGALQYCNLHLVKGEKPLKLEGRSSPVYTLLPCTQIISDSTTVGKYCEHQYTLMSKLKHSTDLARSQTPSIEWQNCG